jgi:hypothetical protein
MKFRVFATLAVLLVILVAFYVRNGTTSVGPSTTTSSGSGINLNK